MKVIFLDFDGVITTLESRWNIDLEKCKLVKRICDETGALFQEKGINWNDYPTKFKRGSCCIKKYHQTMNQTLRSYWFIDNEIPIFKGEDREYIEKLIA